MPGPEAAHPLQRAGSYQYLPACALSGGSNDYLVPTLGDRGNGAGVLGIVVHGLLYLLFTGVGVLIIAFLLGALWMRRRTARRHRVR
jgi:hypothetical protein